MARHLLLCCALAAVSSAALGQAASQPAGKQRAVGTPQGQAKQDQGTARLDTSSLEKTIREVVKEAGEKHDPHADGHANAEAKLVEYTRQLAVETDRLAEFTGWLVGATSVLAAIAFWQVLMFRRQLKIMDSGVEDAKAVAEAAKASADFAKSEFFASHRPRLLIRRISFEMHGRTPVSLKYTVHNVGDADGTIAAISGYLWLPNEGESLAAISYAAPMAADIQIESGGSRPLSIEIAQVNDDIGAFFGFGRGARIVFVGYMSYTDRAGITRQTAFLREYNHDTKLFSAIDHPDYEYQD